MRPLAVLLLLGLCATTASAAECDLAPYHRGTYAGYSAKYKQFAVRRTFFFRRCDDGPEVPGVTALQPSLHTFDASKAGATCKELCGTLKLPCGKLAGECCLNTAWFAWPDGKPALHQKYSCDEKTNATSTTPNGRTAHATKFDCMCEEAKPAHLFTGVAIMMELELVEVYTADATLKRTFLARDELQPLLDKLRKGLGPKHPARALVDREVLPAEKWRAHAADGAFEAAAAAAAHPAGLCTTQLDFVAGGDDKDAEINAAVTLPDGKRHTITSDSWVTEGVVLESWWVPLPKPLLVAVIREKDEPTGLVYLVSGKPLAPCAK